MGQDNRFTGLSILTESRNLQAVGASSPARLVAFTNRQLNRGLFLSDRVPPFYAKTQVFHKRHKISSASAVEEALITISTAEFTLVSKCSYQQN
jgi:hypothetical protein